MKRGFGIAGTAASLLFLFASSAANASDSGPQQNRGRGQDHPTYSVAEPSAIALFGAGLVALGIYAKRKNHKRS